jgi:predicted enzyme related to lactoylglutathione lyase
MLQPNVPAWFEIPSADFARAVRFYETVLEARLTRDDMGPMTMGVFPHQKPQATGAVVKAPGYVPTESGTVVYLHLDDIRPAISRVNAAGGQVLLPLTELPGGQGVFAQIRDTEGNRVGLFSAK